MNPPFLASHEACLTPDHAFARWFHRPWIDPKVYCCIRRRDEQRLEQREVSVCWGPSEGASDIGGFISLRPGTFAKGVEELTSVSKSELVRVPSEVRRECLKANQDREETEG